MLLCCCSGSTLTSALFLPSAIQIIAPVNVNTMKKSGLLRQIGLSKLCKFRSDCSYISQCLQVIKNLLTALLHCKTTMFFFPDNYGCCCSNSHNEVPQGAQRNISIVAHTQHRSPSLIFMDKLVAILDFPIFFFNFYVII